MVYQHPLAYLLGIEGVSLLRAFGGDFDREFVAARIAEVRRLLDSPELDVEGVEAPQVGTVDGYRVWSRTYDEPGNGIFAYEQPYVHAILGTLPTGVALDAACGTGRHTEHLVRLGHRVIGVDSSPDMLARAGARVPQADLRQGDLRHLPLAEDEADIVVCTLALTHEPDLAPVLAEFARVLRPGGHLIIADVHHLHVRLGSMPRVRDDEGRPGILPAYFHLASDYLGAALPLGFQVRACHEPRGPVPEVSPADPVTVGPWDGWPWSLLNVVPEATRAAFGGTPVTVVWHFQLAAG
jgi:2-polyprenyl-3-methyl-5-hydroxy-6-metoxy-1,4-benzoquinol methylase